MKSMSQSIENMRSIKGNPVPNQYTAAMYHNGKLHQWFKSYNTIICLKAGSMVYLDPTYDCSRTTMRYLTQFLQTDMKTIRKKIKDGIYIITDLNS